jgi:ABC-type Fe3+/spermidine/putrescine transport system ATPase subunit
MLEVNHISFAYDSKKVITNISFSIPKGQHVAIVGESGCGKSTLLKLIYGLYDLDKGSIAYHGRPVLGPKFNLVPGMDFMKYLAQDFDLMPFISVAENIGKYLSNAYKDRKTARINELLDMVEMTEFARTKAKYLSGGQQQRVALAMVLALEPEVLLLDEPFSQIDAFRRNNLRRNLFQYLKEKKITCIVATHDSTDILGFADQAVIMRNGEMIRKENPKRLYEHPDDFYTASLFGEVNEIPLHLIRSEKDKGKTVLLYPHQLQIVSRPALKARIKKSFFKGDGYLIEAAFESQKIFFENPDFIEPGTEVFLSEKTNPNQTG